MDYEYWRWNHSDVAPILQNIKKEIDLNLSKVKLIREPVIVYEYPYGDEGVDILEIIRLYYVKRDWRVKIKVVYDKTHPLKYKYIVKMNNPLEEENCILEKRGIFKNLVIDLLKKYKVR